MAERTPSIVSTLDSSFYAIQSALDGIWSNLSQEGGNGDPSPKRMLFVSSVHAEGTTTICGCTAIALARHLRQSVLLIETNCYAPGLAGYLGMGSLPGLREVMDGTATLEEAIRQTAVAGLSVLPAGACRVPEPGEFATRAFAALFSKAEKHHRFVLLDAPPVLLYPEARVLLKQVSESVLVLRAGSTVHQQAKSAVKILQASDVPLAGVVMNRYSPDVPNWLAKRGFH